MPSTFLGTMLRAMAGSTFVRVHYAIVELHMTMSCLFYFIFHLYLSFFVVMS